MIKNLPFCCDRMGQLLYSVTSGDEYDIYKTEEYIQDFDTIAEKDEVVSMVAGNDDFYKTVENDQDFATIAKYDY